MAEFLEVIRQAHRMCEKYACKDCPLCSEEMSVDCSGAFYGRRRT